MVGVEEIFSVAALSVVGSSEICPYRRPLRLTSLCASVALNQVPFLTQVHVVRVSKGKMGRHGGHPSRPTGVASTPVSRFMDLFVV